MTTRSKIGVSVEVTFYSLFFSLSLSPTLLINRCNDSDCPGVASSDAASSARSRRREHQWRHSPQLASRQRTLSIIREYPNILSLLLPLFLLSLLPPPLSSPFIWSLMILNISEPRKQLDKHLQIEKSNIVEIDSRVDHLSSM